MNQTFDRMKQRLHLRATSYRDTFTMSSKIDATPWWKFWVKLAPENFTPTGEVVLQDLAKYCYANQTTLKVSPVTRITDPYAMAFAEGRRDVFNRITAMCNLNSTQIDRIINARSENDA
jgi:hypothetical protein